MIFSLLSHPPRRCNRACYPPSHTHARGGQRGARPIFLPSMGGTPLPQHPPEHTLFPPQKSSAQKAHPRRPLFPRAAADVCALCNRCQQTRPTSSPPNPNHIELLGEGTAPTKKWPHKSTPRGDELRCTPPSLSPCAWRGYTHSVVSRPPLHLPSPSLHQ